MFCYSDMSIILAELKKNIYLHYSIKQVGNQDNLLNLFIFNKMSPQPIHIKMDFKTIHQSNNPVSLVSYQKIDGFTSKSQKP